MEKKGARFTSTMAVQSVAPAPLMKDGDLIILYCGRDNIVPLTLKNNAIFRNKHGEFKHNDMIGHPIGSKVRSSGKRDKGGFIYALRPTPELWTAGALRHRTQIIYSVDISMIVFHLQLKPGHIVVESGTGSGSLSRSFARIVAPHGHLHTFEFHEQRATANREDFENQGLGDLITVTHRDVCAKGFKTEKLGGAGTFTAPPPSVPKRKIRADAVFLDLPSPWEAVDHAAAVLRPYGRLCAFTPSIEQVQRTYQALYAAGFAEMKTIECLLRPYRVHPENVDRFDLSAFFAPDSDDAAGGKATETASGVDAVDKAEDAEERPRKRGRDDFEAANKDKERKEKDEMEEEEKEGDKEEEEEEEEKEDEEKEKEKEKEERKTSGAAGGRASGGGRAKKAASATFVPMVQERTTVIEPLPDMRGHTSFLTFAVKLARPPSSSSFSS